MKTLYLIVSILFLCSCNSKDSNEKVSSEKIEVPTEYEQSVKPFSSEIPYAFLQPVRLKWYGQSYDFLKNELDSLGLSYRTITEEEHLNEFANWIDFEDVESPLFEIISNDTIEVGDLKFEIIFDEKLSYYESWGYYGGIEEMKIYKKGKLIQTMYNIEDPTVTGVFNFAVGDYNLDGHLDLKMRINDRFFKFLLFNPVSQKFEHIESWDYLRTFNFNPEKDKLLTAPLGTCCYGDFYLYQVKNTDLKKIKTYYYHTEEDSIGSFTSFITEVKMK